MAGWQDGRMADGRMAGWSTGGGVLPRSFLPPPIPSSLNSRKLEKGQVPPSCHPSIRGRLLPTVGWMAGWAVGQAGLLPSLHPAYRTAGDGA
jgi:hypothetical protein